MRVLFVHGTNLFRTNNQNKRWDLSNSSFRKQIESFIKETDKPIVFESFEWSGKNSEEDRRHAAHKLARYLSDEQPTIIVAHSHGGTISHNAIGKLMQKKGKYAPWICGLISLGTPLIATRLDFLGARILGSTRLKSITAIFLANLVFLATAYLPLLQRGMNPVEAYQYYASVLNYLPVLMLLPIICIIAWVIIGNLDIRRRQNQLNRNADSIYQAGAIDRFRNYFHMDDEVIFLMQPLAEQIEAEKAGRRDFDIDPPIEQVASFLVQSEVQDFASKNMFPRSVVFTIVVTAISAFIELTYPGVITPVRHVALFLGAFALSMTGLMLFRLLAPLLIRQRSFRRLFTTPVRLKVHEMFCRTILGLDRSVPNLARVITGYYGSNKGIPIDPEDDEDPVRASRRIYSEALYRNADEHAPVFLRVAKNFAYMSHYLKEDLSVSDIFAYLVSHETWIHNSYFDVPEAAFFVAEEIVSLSNGQSELTQACKDGLAEFEMKASQLAPKKLNELLKSDEAILH